MAMWTEDELQKIGASEELEVASLRRDSTLSNAVTIWVVRVADDLYVRSWKGDGGAWFCATHACRAGHIKAGGVGKDVAFVAEADDDINDQIDAAYRTKYRRHGGRYVDPMVAPYGPSHDDQARAALDNGIARRAETRSRHGPSDVERHRGGTRHGQPPCRPRSCRSWTGTRTAATSRVS